MNPSLNRSSESTESTEQSLSSPEQTVNLLSEPSQPESLAANLAAETTSQTAALPNITKARFYEHGRIHPISPPTEAIQYRAIGLVRGLYMPSADQFTQGTLLADDHTLIDAVLLGRILSVMKKHLNLSEPHLWVVYPRTRKEDNKLHVQIVGAWEPEHLYKTTPSPLPETIAGQYPGISDGYFSIRGEVVFQSQEEGHAVVKIIQAPRKGEDKPRFFKLKLKCPLEDKMVGHFWDFQVKRQGDDLIIQDGKDIAALPKKKKKPYKGKKSGDKKPGEKKTLSSEPGGDQPPTEAPPRSGPLPKPTKRSSEAPKP